MAIISLFLGFLLLPNSSFGMEPANEKIKTICHTEMTRTERAQCEALIETNVFDAEAVTACAMVHKPNADLLKCWQTIANRQYPAGVPTECRYQHGSFSRFWNCLDMTGEIAKR